MIPFIIAYLIMLCFYLDIKPSGRIPMHAIHKVILATMYYIFAIVQFHNNYELLSFHLLLMLALFFAWMGDLFLLFDLDRGGDFFFCGNVCFFTYEMAACIAQGRDFLSFGWVIPLTVLLAAVFIFLAHKHPKLQKLGKMKWPIALYISSITLHGLMGLALMILLPGSKLAMLGLGSLLFMVSDYILAVGMFVILNNKWIERGNSIFYFGGLLLIVLSMA